MSEPHAPAPPNAAPVPEAFAGAERFTRGGDAPFLLAGDDVWFVAAGQVDVFGVRLDGDRQPVGPRHHLLRVDTGGALFGTGPAVASGRWGLLVVGATGTQVLKSSRAALAGAAPAWVEPWIDSLCAAMTADRLPAVSIELVAGEESEQAPGANVRPRAERAWVSHLEGSTRLLGREGLELAGDEFVPLSRSAWLTVVEPARLKLALTGELAAGALWSGLDRLHDLVLRYVEVDQRETEQALIERMRAKGAARQALLREACERLAASVTPGQESVAAPGTAVAAAEQDDPLYAACARVARELQLTLRPYPRVQGAPPPRDPLVAILRASRVRSRQVALRGEWWTADNGPLLAFVTEGKRPVALLYQASSGPYLIYDPADRSTRVVDAAVAETLDGLAHSFYRPFPESRLGVRDVLRFAVQGSWRDFGVVVAMALGASLLGMVPAMATGVLFNTVIPGAQRSQLLQISWVLLACALTAALFSLVQGIALLRIEGRASAALQSAVWDRLLGLPLPFFRGYTSGDLATRAMSIDAIRQVVSGATTSALLGSVLASGNFALMYWYSWEMALWATLVIAIVIGLTLGGGYLQLRPQRQGQKLQSKVAGLVLQLLGSIAKLRVAAAEVPAFALWVNRFSEQRRLQYETRSLSNWVAAINAAVPVVSYMVVFWAGLRLITEDQVLKTGDFLAFLSAFGATTSAATTTSLALLTTLNVVPMYEQAKPILETLPEVDLAKTDPGVLTGDIEVQHAVFRYQADGPMILRDLSFHIKPGEFVAFVGPSGSGKSTLLRLLLGFEKLETGAVYFDGQELGGLDVQAVRRQMGVVLQSGRMLSGDIFSNIVGSGSATIDDAW